MEGPDRLTDTAFRAQVQEDARLSAFAVLRNRGSRLSPERLASLVALRDLDPEVEVDLIGDPARAQARYQHR